MDLLQHFNEITKKLSGDSLESYYKAIISNNYAIITAVCITVCAILILLKRIFGELVQPVECVGPIVNNRRESVWSTDYVGSTRWHMPRLSHALICAGISFIGGLFGGPIGLGIGGAIGGAAAYKFAKWQNDSPMVGSIHSKSSLLIKMGIVFAVVSILCVILGGRNCSAVKGFLLELIAHGTSQWKNLFNIFGLAFEKIQTGFSKQCPAISCLFRFATSPISLGVSAVGAIGFMAYKVYKSARGSEQLEKAINYLKSERGNKTVLISSGATVITGSIAFAIYKFPLGNKVADLLLIVPILVNVLKSTFFIIGAACCTVGVLSFLAYKHKDAIVPKINESVGQIRDLKYTDLNIPMQKLKEKLQSMQIPKKIEALNLREKIALTHQIIIESMQKQLISINKTIEAMKSNDFVISALHRIDTINQHPTKQHLMKIICSPCFVNNSLICGGLGIFGYLFGNWTSFFVGTTFGGLVLYGISLCDTGSTMVGDVIMEHLGVEKTQTHWLNLFGKVYKLQLPDEDITSIKQWEDHKKAAVFQSFLSLMLNDLKFKVSELQVKLERSTNPEQIDMIDPITSTTAQQTDINQAHIILRSMKKGEKLDFTQQINDDAESSDNDPRKSSTISMVFGDETTK